MRPSSTGSSRRSRTSNSSTPSCVPVPSRAAPRGFARAVLAVAVRHVRVRGQPSSTDLPHPAVTGRPRAANRPRTRLHRPDHGSRRVGARRALARHRRASVLAERRPADDAGVEHEDPHRRGRRRGARVGLPVHDHPRDVRHDRQRCPARRSVRAQQRRSVDQHPRGARRRRARSSGPARSGRPASPRSTGASSATIRRSTTRGSARGGRGTTCNTGTRRRSARSSSTRTWRPSTVAPGAAAGDPVILRLTPGSGFTVLNRAVTGAADSTDTFDYRRHLDRPTLELTGSMPAGSKETVRNVAVVNPTVFYCAGRQGRSCGARHRGQRRGGRSR